MKPESKMARIKSNAYSQILSIYKQSIEDIKNKCKISEYNPIKTYVKIMEVVENLHRINPFIDEMLDDISSLYEFEEKCAYEYFKAYIFYITEAKTLNEIEKRINEVTKILNYVPENIMELLKNVDMDEDIKLSNEKKTRI